MRRRTKPGGHGKRAHREDDSNATWADYKDVLKAEQEAVATSGSGLHKESIPFSFTRPPKKTNRLLFALLFSFLLHLSMVTIFKIVIFFPRHDIEYLPFDIVPTDAGSTVSLGLSHELTLGGMESLFNDSTPVEDSSLRMRDSLPDIDLPTMEFAELDRLQVRQEGLRTRSLYDQLAANEPKDSWGRFMQGVGSLGSQLARLTLGGEDDGGVNGGRPKAKPQVFEPASGFQGTLIWEKGIASRALLFAPTLDVLMDVDPVSLDKPIEVIIQVNALGSVVNVYSPTVSESDLVDEVQFAILSRYRFAPLEGDSEALQTASILIRAMVDAP